MNQILDLHTVQVIREMVDDILAYLPDRLGIDEMIAGCEVISMDTYGVGLGVYPRDITVALAGQEHLPVTYRGGMDITVGSICTVAHQRKGDFYEVVGVSGGTVPAPLVHALLSDRHSDTDPAAVAQGAIVRGNATPEWELYDASTAGQVLVGDGTDVVSEVFVRFGAAEPAVMWAGMLWVDTTGAPVLKVRNAANDGWYTIAGGAIGLDDLTDVDLTTDPPDDGQVLVYDDGSGLWVPDDPAGHAPVTLSVDAATVLSLNVQEIGLEDQAANEVFAGPIVGVGAPPAFRALDADDLPSHSHTEADITDLDHDAVSIQGSAVSAIPPADDQVLVWDDLASEWVPEDQSGGVTDHGDLAGLGDDDHTQYLLESGTRAGSSVQAQDFGYLGILTDNIDESAVDAGVTIEGVLIDDGAVDGVDISAHVLDDSAHHDPITLAADADTLLGLTGQEITLDSKQANSVFAGPTVGPSTDPTFRALVDADIPSSITRDSELLAHTNIANAHQALVTLAADADVLLGLAGQQLTLDSQLANQVLAGPNSGGSLDPTFRSLVNADLPTMISVATLTASVRTSGWLPVGAYADSPYLMSTTAYPYIMMIPRDCVLKIANMAFYVNTPNGPVNYWNIAIRRLSDNGDVVTTNTASGVGVATWAQKIQTMTISLITSYIGLYVIVTKTGSPGTLIMAPPALYVY